VIFPSRGRADSVSERVKKCLGSIIVAGPKTEAATNRRTRTRNGFVPCSQISHTLILQPHLQCSLGHVTKFITSDDVSLSESLPRVERHIVIHGSTYRANVGGPILLFEYGAPLNQ